MNEYQSFTLTMNPESAMAAKRGYEREGYRVQMSEIGFPNPLTGQTKYYFSLTKQVGAK